MKLTKQQKRILYEIPRERAEKELSVIQDDILESLMKQVWARIQSRDSQVIQSKTTEPLKIDIRLALAYRRAVVRMIRQYIDNGRRIASIRRLAYRQKHKTLLRGLKLKVKEFQYLENDITNAYAIRGAVYSKWIVEKVNKWADDMTKARFRYNIDRARDVMKSGIVNGYTRKQMREAMLTRFANYNKYELDRVITTESTRAINIGTFKDESDDPLVIGWTWHVNYVGCEVCDAKEGTFIPKGTISGDDIPPAHPNCECTLEPVFATEPLAAEYLAQNPDASPFATEPVKDAILSQLTGQDAFEKLPNDYSELESTAKNSYHLNNEMKSIYSNAMAFDDEHVKEVLRRLNMTKEQVLTKITEARRLLLTAEDSVVEHFNLSADKFKVRRERLHKRIAQALVNRVEKTAGTPTLLMTGGLPGAGKSSIMRSSYYAGWKQKYVHIDSDYIKRVLARADGYRLTWRAKLYQKEADAVIAEITKRAQKAGKSVLFDATTKNSEEAMKVYNAYYAAGYKVEIAFADLPPEKCVQRAIARFLGKEKRFVDPVYVASHDSRNIATFNELKKQEGVVWKHWDTDIPRGAEAKLIASGGKERFDIIEKPDEVLKKFRTSNSWQKSLTAEQKDALQKYTDVQYKAIRAPYENIAAGRWKMEDVLKDPKKVENMKKADLIEKALARAPKYEAEIYRGEKFSKVFGEDIDPVKKAAYERLLGKFEKGGVIELDSLRSFTKDQHIARSFMKTDQPTKGRFFITIKDRAPKVSGEVTAFSTYSIEKEILVGRTNKYRVVSCEKVVIDQTDNYYHNVVLENI